MSVDGWVDYIHTHTYENTTTMSKYQITGSWKDMPAATHS